MDEPHNLEGRNALAAKTFPGQWAKALREKGERGRRRRHNLRRRAEDTLKLKALREAGASCASCRDFAAMPGPGAKGQRICDAKSDHQGYAITTAENLCTDWSAR